MNSFSYPHFSLGCVVSGDNSPRKTRSTTHFSAISSYGSTLGPQPAGIFGWGWGAKWL